MKKTILAAALVAASTTAFADTSLSGHVNYVAGDLEDFSGDEDFTVDNANTSKSRFRIKASREASGVTYGLTQEFGVNTGSSVDQRVNEFYLKGAFGKLSLGQGSEAGDGLAENDFSGTYVLNNSSYESWGGVNVSNIDGGRDERLRYDTPKLGNIATLSVDLDTNDDVSVGAGLGGSFWKLGVYAEDRDANDSDEIGGSIAVKLAGFTAAVHAGERDATGATTDPDDNFGDVEFTRVVLGYNAGSFSIAVDAATNERDTVAVGATTNGKLDTETVGLSFVYRPTSGVELYAGYREATDNEATTTTSVFANNEEDADGFLFGGRVKF